MRDSSLILLAVGAVAIYYLMNHHSSAAAVPRVAPGSAAPARTGNAYVNAGIDLAAKYGDDIIDLFRDNSAPPSDTVSL
jgi:hypothetical protein